MAQADSAPDRRAVIDALWLAFSQSPVASTLGESGLRSVVEVQFGELVADGSFDLQQVWELLESQPGLDLQTCIPAMCQFKLWEERLGIPVRLPPSLANLSRAEIARRALESAVSGAQSSRMFRLQEARARRVSGPAPAVQQELVVETSRSEKAARPRRKGMEVAAGVVALLGFATAAVLGIGELSREPAWSALPTGFSGDIPVREASRLGNQVGAVLADPGWLQLPEARRRAHMETALRSLRSEGVGVFFVTGDDKQVLATAQWNDAARGCDVRFTGGR